MKEFIESLSGRYGIYRVQQIHRTTVRHLIRRSSGSVCPAILRISLVRATRLRPVLIYRLQDQKMSGGSWCGVLLYSWQEGRAWVLAGLTKGRLLSEVNLAAGLPQMSVHEAHTPLLKWMVLLDSDSRLRLL